VFAFDSQVLGEQGPSPGAAPATVKEIVVQSVVHITANAQPSWQPLGQEQTPTMRVGYMYRLELNSTGDIIGGEWLTADRPDFLWKLDEPKFVGGWAELERIYKSSIRSI